MSFYTLTFTVVDRTDIHYVLKVAVDTLNLEELFVTERYVLS
jgi:hypothetical protein